MSDTAKTGTRVFSGSDIATRRVRVSICMVAYNHERYIAQAIESVLAQSTNFDFEVVVGEDCSTDQTREILLRLAAEHPQKIRLRLAERNEGASHNFVQTLAQCRGEFVVILEGDDYFSSLEKIQKQVDALDAHPEWAMCFHPTRCLYESGATGPEFTPEKWDRPEATIHDLFERNFMATSSVMFRHGLYDELPDWFTEVVIGDWVLHILNAVHGKIGYLPEPMSVYRIHAGGIFSSQCLSFKLTTILKMLTKVDHYLGGRYSREIDEHRLNTVRWLVGQWENEQRLAKEAINRVAKLEADLLRLADDSSHDDRVAAARRMIEKNVRLAKCISDLERQLAQVSRETAIFRNEAEKAITEYWNLHNELSELRSFHQNWNNAVLYRIYRETVRPFQRLRQYWKSRRAAQQDPPPARDESDRRRAA